MNERDKKSSNQTHNLGSGYGSEDAPLEDAYSPAKTKNKRNDSNSDEYEEEDDVKSLKNYRLYRQTSPPSGFEFGFDPRRISRLSQPFRPGKISGITNVSNSTFNKRSGILDIPSMSERDSYSGQGSGQRQHNPAFSMTRDFD